jgi:HAD superfamily hydrolase (TIGR01450 family)
LSPFDIEKRDWVEIDDYDDLAVADEKFSNLNIDDIKLLFIDLDGTLYLGDEVIEGAADFINRVKASGKLFKLFSNNSSKNKKQYVEKLARYGVSVSEESIILSTDGAIAHLTNTGVKSVYVVGTEALREAVESAGIKTTSESYEMVLIGYDTELTYSKLAKASLLIHQGCSYMATHSDVVCPTAEGPIPDIGSMIALIEKATGTPPEKIFGKPSAEMVNHILKSMDVDPKHVVFIGDRLYTDMVMAQNVGAKFVLVLSGEAKREDVEEMVDNPDLIIPSVAKLL